MDENGFHQGIRALSPDESHEHFAELCALSTSGTLTAEEQMELQEHLAGCAACRMMKRQYQALVSHTIPKLAPEPEPADTGEGDEPLPPVSAEYALLQRLEAEGEPDIARPSAPPLPIYRRGGWRRWVVAAALLIATCAIGYRFGVQAGKRTSDGLPAVGPVGGVRPTPIQPQTAPAPMPAKSATRDHASSLQAEVRAVQLEAAKLREQKEQLEERLSRQSADLNRDAEERAELDKKLAASQTALQSIETKLDLATTQQSGQDKAQLVDQQTRISELSASLRERDQKVTQDEQLLEHDRDIRNLMGARDLYIAEIYDVAKNGDTQKPFGRVFYTKGKSLVFYAYDLDQQAGLKRASTFQAWGRTGSDPKQDRNLGIFYQDEINKQRWILKSNDAKTLSQIDAVFVTVEPNGESTKPSGKTLLFTYLRMTPNHP